MSRALDRNPTFDLAKLVSFNRGDVSDRAPGSWAQTGTLVGNASVSGGVLVLDGTGDYVTYPDADHLSFTDGAGNDLPFSVSCWVNPSSVTNAYRVAVAKFTTAGREWAFYATSNFSTGSAIKGPALYLVNSAGTALICRGKIAQPLSAGSWAHIAATYSGNESTTGINVYVNGVDVDDGNVTLSTYTGMTNGSAVLSIGAEGGGTQAFAGSIDDVRIYRRELSAAEIGGIYASGRQ